MIHWSRSLAPHTLRSCSNLDPLASVEGWVCHSSGGELLDGSPPDEGDDRLFEHGSRGERPYRGSLSLERDRRGGIDGRFAGHEASKARVEKGSRSVLEYMSMGVGRTTQL